MVKNKPSLLPPFPHLSQAQLQSLILNSCPCEGQWGSRDGEWGYGDGERGSWDEEWGYGGGEWRYGDGEWGLLSTLHPALPPLPLHSPQGNLCPSTQSMISSSLVLTDLLLKLFLLVSILYGIFLVHKSLSPEAPGPVLRDGPQGGWNQPCPPRPLLTDTPQPCTTTAF